MKQLYSLYILFSLIFLYGCVEDTVVPSNLQNAKKPEVGLVKIDELSVTAQTAVLSAEVLKENGSAVIARGVCWNTSPNPTLHDYKKADISKGKGAFEISINNLEKDTRFYFRCYAINAVDTAYSAKDTEFETKSGLGVLMLISPDPDSIKATSAISGGVITVHGEGPDKRRGLYLSSGDNNNPTEKECDSVYISPTPMEMDSFVCHLSLNPQTKYYVRAFVDNNYGTYTSEVDSFSTPNGHPSIRPNLEILSRGYNKVYLEAEVFSEGDSPVTQYGLCWAETENPTIESDTTVSGSGKGVFTDSIINLKANTSYFIRSYATNSFETVYSDNLTFQTESDLPSVHTNTSVEMANATATIGGELIEKGFGTIIEVGMCWSSTSQMPDLDDVEHVLPCALQDNNRFEAVLTGLRGDVVHYIRAYVKYSLDAESTKVEYGSVERFQTPPIFLELNDFSTVNRSFSTAFSLNNQAFIVGGDLGSDCSSEAYGYDTNTGKWWPMSPYAHAAKRMTSCVNGNMAYVFGGVDKQGLEIKEWYMYSDNVWTPLAAYDHACYDAVGFSYQDSIYQLGGKRGAVANNEVWRYDIQGKDWKRLTDFPVVQSRGIALQVDSVVYAGLGEVASSDTRGFWTSADSLTEWEQIEDIPADIATVSSCALYEKSIYMVDDNGVLWIFNTVDKTWIKRTVFPMQVRQGNYHIFILSNKIYIMGQELYSPNKFMLYDPVWDN